MTTIRVTRRPTAAMSPLGWTLWGAVGLYLGYCYVRVLWELLTAILGVFLMFLAPTLGIEHFTDITVIPRLLYLQAVPLLAGAVTTGAALCVPAVRALPGARRVEVTGACALTAVLTTGVVLLST